MNLESLLICQDAALLGVLRPTLEKIAVNIQVCAEIKPATDLLAKCKFDAVIVDCDDLPGGADLLRSIRKTQSNARAVSFAVLNGKTSTQEAFKSGANFVLQKPLTLLSATRCFNAALNFMVRERRRYFRYPVEMPVRIIPPNTPEMNATSTNVSEGGMAIRLTGKLSRDGDVKLQFSLPGSSTSLELKGEIAWTDGTGHAGIRFLGVPQSSQYQLDKWLTERIQSELPKKLQDYVSLP
jgi:DNA-binding response OmpR family regulator